MEADATATEAPVEMLVTRRSKRSTAGNRMVAALAEIGMEELTQDPEEDADFVNDKIEEDVFGSDFESTDEEAEKEAEVQGETEAVHEERTTRKTARTRLERITAAAHARNRQTFNPDIQIATKAKAKPKPKGTKTVRLGPVIDAETGEARYEATGLVHPGQQRTSKRKHTVQSTTATVTRIKQSEARRAALPKKTKVETRQFSQAELIAQALDTEEGNIVEHRDYLKNEEEKRKKARVVRTTISGPVLRWISKTEEVKVPVPPPPPPPPPAAPAPVISPPTTSTFPTISPPAASPFATTSPPTTSTYATGTAPVAAPATSSSIAPTLPAVYRGMFGQPYNYTTGTTTFPTSTIFSTTSSSLPRTFSAASAQSTFSYNPYQGYLPNHASSSTMSSFPVWPPAAPASQAAHMSTFSVAPHAPAVTSTTAPYGAAPTTPAITTTPATATPTSSASATVTSIVATQPDSQPVASSSTSSPAVPAPSAPESQKLSDPGSSTTATPAAAEPEPEFKMETVTKNYVVHELDQEKGTPKPTWTESMTAMFGDHVKWDQVKVFVGKNRPLYRHRYTCPITGRQAHYMDPRTGVPYADSQAYKILTSVLNHEYVWNPSLGCYTNYDPPPTRAAQGNSTPTEDAMAVDS